MRFNFISVFLFSILVSCANQEHNSEIDTIELKAEVLQLSEEALLRPEKILIHENLILTAYRGQENLFRAFDKSSGLFRGAFGRVGYGPEDYTDMELRTLQEFHRYIVGIDASSNQVYFIDLNDSSKNIDILKASIHQIPLETQFTNDLIFLNDSSVVGHSNSDLLDSQLFKYNLETKKLTEFLSYNMDLFSYSGSLELPSKYELFFKKLIAHPRERKFAVLNTKYNMTTVFDYDLNILNQKNYSDKKYMKNLIKKDHFNSSASFNFNLDVSASTTNIFGLYTGHSNDKMKNMSTKELLEMRSIINVWNWNSELVKKIILDRPISHITYDLNTNSIYAINPYSLDEIYIYKLPNL